MKLYYEARSKTSLIRRTPVIIRLDGKAFHTFTKGFVKPFDECMSKAMQETMKYLCENIQGCVLGYTQSDKLLAYRQRNSDFCRGRKELYREIDMMLIGQLIEILKQYDSDREVMIHTLKGEKVEVNGYFIPKNLDESIFYLTDLDVIPRN